MNHFRMENIGNVENISEILGLEWKLLKRKMEKTNLDSRNLVINISKLKWISQTNEYY